MYELAEVLCRPSKYRSAEKMYWKVLELRQKVLGLQHRDTLSGMHRLAWTLAKQAQYDSAEEV